MDSLLTNFYGLFTFGHTEQQTSQKDILRSRYYQELTTFESLSVFYGELGYVIKGVLLTSISTGWIYCVAFYANPILISIISVIFILMALFQFQYNSMEARFNRMVKDLDVSERQLTQASELNLDLEKQISVIVEENEVIVDQLKYAREEVEKIKDRILSKEDQVNKAGLFAEETITEITDIANKIHSENRALSAIFHEYKAIVHQSHFIFFQPHALDTVIADSREMVDEARQFRKSIDDYLIQFGE